MRPMLALLLADSHASFLVTSSKGQAAQEIAPVPADVHELVTGRVESLDTPKQMSDALALLDRARENLTIYANGGPAYAIKVSFTASGAGSYTGPGEMEETRISQTLDRWSASVGDYSILRVASEGMFVDEKKPGPIPLRIQMLRGAILWPIEVATSRDTVRTAAAKWNGDNVTCVLLSRNSAKPPASGRSWKEREYCIDLKSGLLQIYSEAPGIYVVYDYRDALKFHARTLPRQVTIFEAGAKVLDAHLDSIADPAEPGPDDFKPTPQASRLGAALLSPTPFQGPGVQAQVSRIEPIIVHASVGDDGRVLEAEPLQNSDPALFQSALDRVQHVIFGPLAASGRRPTQRELFIEIDFSPWQPQ